MAGITERNQQKLELANVGYSMKYIDEWQPKTTLYRHKASLNVEGEIVREVGTTVGNVPGNPDYVLRKARIGLFQWPPSEGCVCHWCQESFRKPALKERVVQEAEKQIADGEEEKSSPSNMGPHYKG